MSNQIWTDGSNSLKTGWCGWAYHGMIDHKPVVACGYQRGTNQLAELRAVVEAMAALPGGTEIEIISDSMYAINCMSDFRTRWERNGFLTFNGHPISHLELVKRGHREADRLRARFTHVKGHSGDGGNELADALSKSARYVAEGRQPIIDVEPFLKRESCNHENT